MDPGAAFPSTFTQTQHFLQHDSSFSPNSIASAKHSEENLTLGLHSDIDQPLSPEELSIKDMEDHEVDLREEEIGTTPLTNLTTGHTFSHPLTSVGQVESHHSPNFFSAIHEDTQPSGDDEEDDEGGGDSTTSSVHSLSTTPLIPDRMTEVCDTAATLKSTSPPLLAALSEEGERKETPSNDPSTLKLSSSARSQPGHLEETLKSAVHVTQLLMGHASPAQIQIQPVPTIFSSNEVEVESAQALRGLTVASISGEAELDTLDSTSMPEAAENGQQVTEEDHAVPQGPPTFPDSLQLSSHVSGQFGGRENATNHQTAFSTSPEWTFRPRSMAQSSVRLENIGYVKAPMATPHKVGGVSTQSREESETRFVSSGGSLGSRSVENGESLADFIDKPSGGGTQNRLKQWNPDFLGP